MNLSRLIMAAVLAAGVSACAQVETIDRHAAQEPSVDTARAQAYLTKLTLKKNRFLASRGYEADYVAMGTNAPATTEVASTATTCAQIANSQWAASVDAATFDVFTRMIERCYNGGEI